MGGSELMEACKHKWIAIDQEYKAPVLITYYMCPICGEEKEEKDVEEEHYKPEEEGEDERGI
jgi:hypothetical protein